MAEQEQIESECTEESKALGFECPCCNPEFMSKMARILPFLFVTVGAGFLARWLVKKKES